MVKIAEVVGKNARVKCSTNIILGIRDWSIDYTGDPLETTDFDDSGHKTYLVGLDGWTGSFTGFGQPGWSLNALLGTKYRGSFYVSGSTGSYYSGSIYIVGVSPAASVDGLATVSYSFQGTAGLIYT